jgi:hypothetical protein
MKNSHYTGQNEHLEQCMIGMQCWIYCEPDFGMSDKRVLFLLVLSMWEPLKAKLWKYVCSTDMLRTYARR